MNGLCVSSKDVGLGSPLCLAVKDRIPDNGECLFGIVAGLAFMLGIILVVSEGLQGLELCELGMVLVVREGLEGLELLEKLDKVLAARDGLQGLELLKGLVTFLAVREGLPGLE